MALTALYDFVTRWCHNCDKLFYFRYYSATIIKMSGVRDESSAIWLAAGTAFINFIFTVVALFLVERLGRRKLIIGSLAGKINYRSIGLDKQKLQPKIVNIFLPMNFNICFGCSEEPSHWDGSFESPQHMFWLKNKKIIFLVCALN